MLGRFLLGGCLISLVMKEANSLNSQTIAQNIFKYDEMKFADVTGDETWCHHLEPVRKVINEIWATRNS